MMKKNLTIILLVVILFIFGLAGFFTIFYQFGGQVAEVSKKIPPKPAPNAYISPSSSYLWYEWKVYNNEKYGFSITYPARGNFFDLDQIKQAGSGVCFDAKGNINSNCIKECGKEIKEKNYFPQTHITGFGFDNFFILTIRKWDKTVKQYIEEAGATGLYNFKQLSVSGADEAVALGELDTEEYKKRYPNGGYPPMSYIKAIYRKNNYLYEIMGVQDFIAQKGCLGIGLGTTLWPFDKVVSFK